MKKQLDCELHCKASASLNESVAQDLQIKDRPLKELLDGRDADKDEQEDCD